MPSDKNILLAEDAPDTQALISTYLKTAGYHISIADTGLDTLKQSSRHSFDCIIISMQVPLMSGIDVTKALRASGYDGLIIALASDRLVENKQLYQEAGCDEVISKPIDQDELITLLHTLITKQSTPTSLTSSLLNDAPELADLVKLYIERLPKLVANIESAYANKNWNTLKQLTHNLKSTAGNYGFMPLSKEAEKITNHDFEKLEITFIADTMANIRILYEQILVGGKSLQKIPYKNKKSGTP